MSGEELPEGWASANLFELSQPKQWPTISTKELTPAGYPVYGANGQIGYYSEFNHENPTILITCRGATCGTINVCAPKSYVTGNSMALDEVNDEVVDMSFLRFALQARGLSDTISGSAQPQITRTSLQVVDVLLAPLPEQRRIVEKVESLLEQVNRMKGRLEKVSAILKRFRQSVLAAACSGELTREWREEHPQSNPQGLDACLQVPDEFELPTTWVWVQLETVAEFINGDRSKRYPNKEEYVDSGVPFINTGHIEPNGTLSLDRMNYISREKWASLTGGKIQKGDLVYCLRGATLGKTAFVDPFTEGAIASSLVIIRPQEGILGRYVYCFLTSPLGRNEIRKYDNGSAQPNLSAQNVGLYLVPLPPLPEQHEIVRQVNRLFTLADTIERRVQTAMVRVEKLPQAILAKAFAGELVPTEAELARLEGRTYETAEALLARIRKERGDENTGAKAARKKRGASKKATGNESATD